MDVAEMTKKIVEAIIEPVKNIIVTIAEVLGFSEAVFYKLFQVLVAFGILLIIYQNFAKPRLRGWFGEKTVSAVLSTLPKEYKRLHNIILRRENGRTAQIDHIVVSPFGIFVIETKNYKGYITGNEYGDKWTKNKKYSFQNPIKQNYGHIKALSELLDLPENMFISIVVFSRKSTIKVKTEQHLVYTVNLRKTIRSYQQRKLNDEQVEAFVWTIQNANVDSKETRKEHVENISRESCERNHMIERKICPKCQNALVERNGKYGKFLGCSQYPKCRFTSKL